MDLKCENILILDDNVAELSILKTTNIILQNRSCNFIEQSATPKSSVLNKLAVAKDDASKIVNKKPIKTHQQELS